MATHDLSRIGLLGGADVPDYGSYQNPVTTRHESFSRKFTIAGEPSHGQFWYDCWGLESSLSYNGQTIRDRYQLLYQNYERAEAVLNVNLQEQQELEEALGDEQVELSFQDRQDKEERLAYLKDKQTELEDRSFAAKEALFGKGPKKGPIWDDLSRYLDANLNCKNQAAIKDEVTWRFSQNALVVLQGEVNRYTTEKFGGLFMAPFGEVADYKTCTLEIQRGAAKVIATFKQTFSDFISESTGEYRTLDKPVTVEARIELDIRPNSGLFSCCTSLPVKTTANVDIDIRE